MAQPPLAELLKGIRVLISVGSGGVGKTTISASVALHEALAGKRALCMTIDPAKRLATSLGLTEMRTEEQVVPDSLFAQAGLRPHPTGKLSAMMLDTRSTFDALIRTYAKTKEAADKILENKMYQHISGSLSGTQEYMAMEKLFAVRGDPQYDFIVVDTPPAANAVDFLDAPERLSALVDAPAMKMLAQAFQSSSRVSFASLGKGFSFLIRGLSKITGSGFFEQVSEFVASISDLFGGFQKRAANVKNSLRTPDTGFLLVTSPDPLCVDEAFFLHEKLTELSMHPLAVVINRVHQNPALAAPANTTAAAMVAEVRSKLASSIDADHMQGALTDVLAETVAHAARDDRQIQRLRSLGIPLYLVTDEVVPVYTLGSLETVSRELFTA